LVLFAGIQPQPLDMLRKTGLYEQIGADRFFEHTGEAINYALERLNPAKCRGCKHFVFRECAALSEGKGAQPAAVVAGNS
jgi:SulP family sulfate permease